MARRRHVKPIWPWETFDPRSLVHLARAQFPDDLQLLEALNDSQFARRNSCCDDRVCGYQFFGEDHPDPSRRQRPAFKHTVILLADHALETRDVAIDVADDGRLCAIEFI